MSDLIELEPIEELEPASVDDLGSAAPPLVKAVGGASRLFSLDNLVGSPGPAKNIFRGTIFPVLLMSPDFKLTFVNDSCKTLVRNIPDAKGETFVSVFGKCFEIDDIKEIREAMQQGKNCYAWKGKALIKSRERTTVETRVYIFPTIFENQKPSEFGVMFDDVTEETKGLLRSVFMSLLEASKLKDNDTGMHITRVNFYSEALAKALRNRPGYDTVDADFIDNIAFLAAMHDVGKIGTPDDILNKEGPLSDFEWSVMKEHTINGAFILSTYPNPMAKEIALSHHEKWNGTGYPYQFANDLIPLSARIVSIADVYDALRMKRSYKPPFSHETALSKINEARGTQFDPALVDVALSIADQFNAHYEANADE